MIYKFVFHSQAQDRNFRRSPEREPSSRPLVGLAVLVGGSVNTQQLLLLVVSLAGSCRSCPRRLVPGLDPLAQRPQLVLRERVLKVAESPGDVLAAAEGVAGAFEAADVVLYRKRG